MRSASVILSFFAMAVTTSVFLALTGQGLSLVIAWGSLFGGACVGFLAWRRTPSAPASSLNQWDLLMFLVFALASLRSFLWLIYPSGDFLMVQSANNLGDISKHLQIIRYLAAGASFWPESPFLVGAPLNYYLGVDVWNSLLLLFGVPAERGLIWVGLGASVLSAWALWKWGGTFGLAVFLFNGGLAGFQVFQTRELVDFQADLAWKNFFLAMFVTQRGLLYALPATLFLWSAWRESMFRGRPVVPAWVCFLIYATMPLFSAHAFLATSILLAGIFVFQPSARGRLLVFVGCAVPPATFCAYLVTGGFSIESGVRFLPGWMQGTGGWWFWVLNFGISLPMMAVLAWKVLRSPDPELRSFAGTGLFLFLVACFVAFAPWEWDNTKIFLWAWLLCAPYLWKRVIRPLPLAARTAICFVYFFSGAASLVGGLSNKTGYHLVRISEMNEARAALSRVPPLETIATEPHHGNPVVLLGRPVVCGYEGMLWAHGLDYREKWSALEQVLSKEPGWENQLRELGVSWVYTPGGGLLFVPPQEGLDD
ncbi:MAG: hypothetical protein WEB60_10185 [Terrimicrobiaceae bacterium]